ncbi:hypothetical protein P154DRAFT_527309 [Amniculicola lignicola CBS 123094]|uniref:Uncharacterized protein n=1 Tax=Amniculicola lignicola CBS 123094 TaxID=1392246 RepID=A0A6A5VZG6_9PLEO|nr:hypothetical protein P154DRAFT_527309 [Amniculicola lignicola CBS 123094]
MDSTFQPTKAKNLNYLSLAAQLFAAEMPSGEPPAYHTVVDPQNPIPGLTNNPFTPDDVDPDEEEIPEITINAATQIRGHGNIVAIQPMDVRKIAELVVGVLRGEMPNENGSTPAPVPTTNETTQRGTIGKPWPRINIVVNCGATIVGDRNIVGPGLGDVAKQLHPRNLGQTAARATPESSASSSASGPSYAIPSGQAPTPPPSRSLSESAEGRGTKRKAAEDAEGASEVKRPNF